MNNILVGLKKIIKNKNTVTILGIVLILVLLYFGYNRTVNKTINPINVPVAKNDIGARKEITSEDITYKNIAAITVDDNVIRNAQDLIGKYTNINVSIPAGSVFYKSWIVEKDEIPGNWIEEVKRVNKDYEAYYLSTDVTKTLGNSVIPGSVIDIYMKVPDENGQIMYGRLLENIKVLAVHDGSGNDVFANAANIGSPSRLGFAVNHDFYVLLTKAENLSEIELVIAPQGTELNLTGDISVSSATLRDYIDARTVTLTDEVSNRNTTNQNNKSNNTENKSNTNTSNSNQNNIEVE